MAEFRSRLKKMALLGGGSFLLLVVFLLDVAFRRSEGLELGWLLLLRDLLVLVSFLTFYILIESLWKQSQGPTKKMGFALVLMMAVGAASALFLFFPFSDFDTKNFALIPLGFDTIVWSNIYGIVLSVTMLVMLLILRDIIFSKRRKGTKRNFVILLVLICASSLFTLLYRPMEPSALKSLLYGLTIVAMVLNSFRMSWIVSLSKREKITSMVFGFLLFGMSIGFDFITSRATTMGKCILFYSQPLQAFTSSISYFASIYFGMTFLSTLFHLPTAEVYDRKVSEISLLHNLGRLVTQVFDFHELLETVTTMTLEVCQANSAWLEIFAIQGAQNPERGLHPLREHSQPDVSTVAHKNIPREEIEALMAAHGAMLRQLVEDQGRPVLIDSLKADKRTKAIVEMQPKFSSMVIVPLLSHGTMIGILYTTKDAEYGFDREDVEAVAAFADQATLAIENSRLIEKSLERERLIREMKLAQDMQRKLLPQELPKLWEVDLEALSTPAFEVGGDYYDFTMLDAHHLGVLVGDVSGKGVSAAFYMAEMKGIFQSLSKIYHEPREFLSKAHSTLLGTIDKRSFISLIYAVLDLRTGMMTVARAGHCPMLLASRSSRTAEFIKPRGLGLGMGSRDFFDRTITQEVIHFEPGDIAVLYTDGVTEAHRRDGQEFGYDALREVVQAAGDKSAMGVRDAIIMAVDKHMDHEPPDDDLTIVVMKWLKSNHQHAEN